ncbi:HNH endonuclease [Frigidibacter mobilis]|uniref:HNH endonuclease n=1 Tax=Frigidibacter mobilis TaxID=1335048 RepID=UPI003AAEDED9
MHYHEHNIESGLGKKFPSPQCCIYCDATDVELTDEHVVPYALGANAQVLLKSCCKTCQGLYSPMSSAF